MKKIIVKIGSSVIAPGGKLDSRLLNQFVKDILEVEKKGYKVILVSSGAVACGLAKLGHTRRPTDTTSLMAFSSLGQILLMDVYADKFKKYKRLCAQILLTWEDFDHRRRFLNARQTLEKLLVWNVIPIINENDAVSFDEIRFGDNDRLSALVSDLMSADLLLILSDVEGLLKDNEVVKIVPEITTEVMQLVKKKGQTLTAGGMQSKLETAKIATAAGVPTVIACGRTKRVITRIVSGEPIGTEFLPTKSIGAARKRWIAFSKRVKGTLIIDDGAKEALLNKGKSLLQVGIIEVKGEFVKKDAVEIVDRNGVLVGCGLAQFSSHELQDKRLTKAVIHRDNFVKK